MIRIGEYQTLRVDRLAEQGAYLGSDRDVVLLPKKYFPEKGLEVEDALHVFVYTDSEDRPIATTLKPKAAVGDFACLTVKDVNKFGAFLDWGLEKDLFVPFKEQKVDLECGEKYVVRLLLDKVSQRVIATTKLGAYVKCVNDETSVGDKVSYLVFDIVDDGVKVIVNNSYFGMLYSSELFLPMDIGSIGEAYVKKIRDDDKIDLILRAEGYKGAMEGAPLILEKIKLADGFLPFNGKSSSVEIQRNFQMSKKVFKKIIGGLYKERKITVNDDGIHLV